MFRDQLALRCVVLASVAALGVTACTKDSPSGQAASASISPKTSAPPAVLKDFTAIGVRFQYPEPYSVESSTANPQAYQVAIDHNKEPGVVTIRFNATTPGKALVLDEVANSLRSGDDGEAAVVPAKLKVAGQEYEARALKTRIFGVVQTDTVAVVPLNGSYYVVLTHAADEDLPKAQKLFDAVLGSLQAAK
jgi:hypothetical protein